MVVTYNQPSQCIYWVPSAAGLDGYIHAREDSDVEDIIDPDIQGAFVAEDPLIGSNGFVSGARHVTLEPVDRHSPKINHPPT